MNPTALRSAAARLRRTSDGSIATAARLPLSALRAKLDEESDGAGWLLHPDGVLGRALLVPAGATFTVPLRLRGEASFCARAMLLPHDWRDGRGAVRASVAVTEPDGSEREIWSGILRPANRGRPRGVPVDCVLPASSTSLRLRIAGLRDPPLLAVARAIWLEPAIVDPNGPEAARLTPQLARTTRTTESRPRVDAPLISVLTPVHDPPMHMLEEAIASVRGQTFTDWELCLVDDGSANPDVIAVLERHAASDPRIHVRRQPSAGGISAATNAALELATGDYVALLDHDDSLAADALQEVADLIAAQPDLDMIYTDEDVVGDAGLIERHLKPGWSPEHMSALMYTCHLGVYRRTLALELGGFQSQFDGCQDYDFVLRLAERTDRIAHIPRIAYHWRAHNMSTAGGDAKPHAYLIQPAAIAGHLARSGVEAEVQFSHLPGIHRIVHRVAPSATVDLVLAVDDHRGLTEAASTWMAQAHPAWNVVLAVSAHVHDAAIAALAAAGVALSRVTPVVRRADEEPARALAAAAESASGEYLVLMPSPVAGLTHDWVTRLIGYASQPEIAAAGPVVLAPDGRIQHAGIAVPEGIALYLQYGQHPGAAPPVVYNLSAVSGVLATRRETFRRLGGLDPQFRDLALIEYCLRATDLGQRVVIVPDARVRTTGPDTTTNDLPTIWRLRQRWAENHSHDRYYNRNYRTDRGDFVLADYN